MARKRNKSRTRRVNPTNANRRLPRTTVTSPRYTHQFDIEDYLRNVEDRRYYNPDPVAPALNLSGRVHRLVIPRSRSVTPQSSKPDFFGMPDGVAFKHPEKVLVCVRRKQRKEVLHALRKSGKTGQKKPRRSTYSDVQC